MKVRKLTRFWTDEDGEQYAMVPKALWLEVLEAARHSSVQARSGGGPCESACEGHGGVAFQGGSACCCEDGHCFSV